MSAPHWAGGPQTDHERAGAHAWLTFPGEQPTIPDLPAVPAPREAVDRAAIRAQLRAARDAAITSYAAASRGIADPEGLTAVLAGIAAAQTALDGEAPRRIFNQRSGRRPFWANCGGPR